MIAFTILGQPCSKANSRRIVTLNRGEEDQRAAVVKSKEALAYERDALRQIPAAARQRLELSTLLHDVQTALGSSTPPSLKP